MECERCKTALPDSARFCLTCGMDVSGDTKQHTMADSDPALLSKLQEDVGTDFLVERELGRGGMAIVFLARDIHIGRRVAIKVLPPELTFGHGAGFVDRFKREARTAGGLEHPNIIPIHRVSTEGKLFWYIMKYIEGESLDAVLRREGPLPLRKATDILAPAADALDYAHRKSVIHRDVKPANILLDTEGKVTVTDFGIAKALDGDGLTLSGSILGTPYYMSPEQCAGKQLTGAADQYSLAVMAFQMISGHLPFTGESAVEIIKKHTLDPVPPLGVLRPDVPASAVAAIERALSKTPGERFLTAKAFVRALEFTSDEKTGPMSMSAVGRDAAARPTMRVRLITLRVRLAPVVAWLEAQWARVTPAVARGRATWGALNHRSRLLAAVAGAIDLIALVVVVWPSGEPKTVSRGQAADRGPQTAGVAPGIATQPPAALVAAMVVLRLTVTPAGAAATVDGVPVSRIDSIALAPGTHTISVTKQGFRTWTEGISAGDSLTIARTVALAALPSRVSLSTNLPAKLTINGKAAPNPVTDFEVPAGPVRVHVVVRDASGTWETDSTLTVRAGVTLRKRFQLGASAVATRGSRALRIPVALAANLLEVPDQGKAAALANGYAESDMDVLSPSCARFAALFWDVMGYDIDVGRLCAASAILRVKGNVPERFLNFTRFVRTKDDAIEAVERPSEVAEWRNEVTGKRLRFHLRGDSLEVVDETPSVALVRALTRKAKRSVSVRPVTGGPSVVRIDAFGASVKTPRDSLPVVSIASHAHRIGSCEGKVTFDGKTLRYVPGKGGHSYELGVADIVRGSVASDKGTLRVRVGGGTERLTLREWEPVFEAVLVARIN